MFFLSIFLIILSLQFIVSKNFSNNEIKQILKMYPAQLGSEYYNNGRRELNNTFDSGLDNSTHKRTLQEDQSSSNSSNTDIQAYYFYYNDIKDVGMMREWVNTILLPRLYTSDKNIYFRSNYVIGEPMVHLLVRNGKNHENDDSHSNTIFPYYLGKKIFNLFDHLNGDAWKDDITLSSGQVVKYTEEKNDESLYSLGGYYVHYPRNYTKASELDYLNESTLVLPTWVNIMYTFFYINGNTQLTGASYFYLIRTPSGSLEKHIESHMTRDFYKNNTDYFRAFLEIVFLMLT